MNDRQINEFTEKFNNLRRIVLSTTFLIKKQMGTIGMQTIAVLWMLWMKLIEQITASRSFVIKRSAV